jgi:hypothetical protein
MRIGAPIWERSMKKLCAVALVLSMPVTGVVAQEQQEEAKPKKEKKVCRSEKVTGSLTRVKRICMTQAEWDLLAANTKRGVDDLQRSAGGGKLCSGSDPLSGC